MEESVRRVQTPASRPTVWLGLRKEQIPALRAEVMLFSPSRSLQPSWIPRLQAGARVGSRMWGHQTLFEVNSHPR